MGSIRGRVIDLQTGRPIDGAVIEVGSRRSHTSREGRFSIGALRRDTQVSLTVTHLCYAPYLLSGIEINDSAVEIVAALQRLNPTSELEVTCVDDRGHRVHDAVVTIARRSSFESIASPAPSGRLTASAPVGEYLIGATARKHTRAGFRSLRVMAGRRASVKIRMPRAGQIVGRVRHWARKEVVVWLFREGQSGSSALPQTVRLDGRGRFAVDTDPGAVRVAVLTEEGSTERKRLRVKAAQPVVVTLSISREPLITGVVRNADTGDPIEGATVGFSGSRWHLRTDPSGRFSVSGASLPPILLVEAPGFVPSDVSLDRFESKPRPVLVRVDLRPAGLLRVIVLNRHRKRVGNVSLTIKGKSDSLSTRSNARTGEVLLSLPVGRYTLSESQDRFAPVVFGISAGEERIARVILSRE